MIDITDVDMVKFIQKVYDLSRPQGMGMLHFTPGPMSEEDAKALIQPDGSVSMDYVSGRACKMYVHSRDGRLTINDNWFDHSDTQFEELLEHIGLGKDVPSGSSAPQHGTACNCDDCRHKRGLGPLDPQDASKKQAHDSKYTADGVLLEKGLEVWCVDGSLGDKPWTVHSYHGNYGTWFIVHDEGRRGKRDARYSNMYACKSKAISARMDVIHAQVIKIFKDEINPKKEELRKLMRMAAED